MWWLVMRRPVGETNDPEPPLLKRTDASRVCSSQASVKSKPYFALSCSRGGSLRSHMPSSEYAGIRNVPTTRRVRRERMAGPSLGNAPQELVSADQQVAVRNGDRRQHLVRELVTGELVELRLGLEDHGFALGAGHVQSVSGMDKRPPRLAHQPVAIPKVLSGLQLIAGSEPLL